jgi:hypothetical protein
MDHSILFEAALAAFHPRNGGHCHGHCERAADRRRRIFHLAMMPMVLWHKLYSGNRSHPGLSLCTAPFFDGGVYSHRIALG